MESKYDLRHFFAVHAPMGVVLLYMHHVPIADDRIAGWALCVPIGLVILFTIEQFKLPLIE